MTSRGGRGVQGAGGCQFEVGLEMSDMRELGGWVNTFEPIFLKLDAIFKGIAEVVFLGI